MAELVSVNLNQKVRFRLTVSGLEKAKALAKRECREFSLPKPRVIDTDNDGYYVMSFWDFSNFFGPELYNGTQPLFEQNRVQIIRE